VESVRGGEGYRQSLLGDGRSLLGKVFGGRRSLPGEVSG